MHGGHDMKVRGAKMHRSSWYILETEKGIAENVGKSTHERAI